MRQLLLDTIVKTDYGQFDLVWGEGSGFEGEWDPYFEGQVNGLAGAASDGVYASFGRRSGGSQVTISLCDEPPALPTAEWEDVVEVSLTIPADQELRWQSWAGESSGPLAVPGGNYRLRVSARGRDIGRADEFVEGVVDFYEMELWPAPSEPDAILRVGSEDAAYWHRTLGGRRSPA